MKTLIQNKNHVRLGFFLFGALAQGLVSFLIGRAGEAFPVFQFSIFCAVAWLLISVVSRLFNKTYLSTFFLGMTAQALGNTILLPMPGETIDKEILLPLPQLVIAFAYTVMIFVHDKIVSWNSSGSENEISQK